MTDEDHLAHAVRLADEGWRLGHGGPFGAVVVVAAEGRVVGEGWNRVVVDSDPTAHAEVLALRRAGAELGRFDLRGTVLYASSEPCPLCLAAAHWARVDRVVFAADRREAAAIGFDDAQLYDEFAGDRERSLRVERGPTASGEAARRVMRAWLDSDDRIAY